MRKKNRKGFTLTELLAILVILGVIVAIAVPSYNNLSKKFRNNYYEKLDETILTSAKTYFKDHAEERPVNLLESKVIDLQTLQTNNYLEDATSYKQEGKLEGYVVVIKDKDEYDYKTCLTVSNGSIDTGDYVSLWQSYDVNAIDASDNENNYCNAAWKNSENITKCDADNCEIKNYPDAYLYYDPTYVNNKDNSEKMKDILYIEKTISKLDEDGKLLKYITFDDEKFYPTNISTVNKSVIGEVTLKYDVGKGVSRKLTIFEYPVPDITVNDSSVTLSLNEGITKYFDKHLADDPIEDRITDFDHYKYLIDGDKEWKTTTTKDRTATIKFDEPGEHSIKVRVVDNLDNEGKISDLVTVTVPQKDEATLTVVPKLADGNKYTSGSWTNQNVIFEIIANLGAEGKELRYSIDSVDKGSVTLTDGKATIGVNVNDNSSFQGTYKFWITDTELSDEVVVKIDKIPPKLTVTTTTESGVSYTHKTILGITIDNWINEGVWLKTSPIDNESGLSTVSYKKGLFNYPLASDQNYSDYIDDSYIDKTIKVTAYDNAGNSTEVSTKIQIDKVDPYCSLSIDSSNDQIVYSSHDWEILGIGLGSGVAKDTLPTGLTKEGCPSILNITDTCYAYKAGTFKGRAVDEAGNSYTCSITVPSKSTTTTEVTLSAPTITLNKTSTSSSPSTTNINFTLSNPNSVGTLQYKIGSGSWTNYSGSAVTLINTTGSKTVYARVAYNGKYSSETNKTGYCNKDIATHERQTNGKDTTGCWIQFWMDHNSDYSGNSGVTANRFQYAYWNAKETTDTTNKYWGTSSYNSKLSTECGSAPPQGVRIFDSSTANGGKNSSGQTLTKKLYQKYSSQYYCFAIREYRATEITSVNRWKVWYKNAHTTKSCPTSGYTSQGYGG